MATTKELLREKGIICLCGVIKLDTIPAITDEIIYMNSLENPTFDKIQLIINSVGGSCPAGFMLVDFIEYSKIPIAITGLGICASMGNLILCSGEKGSRVITKNTSLLSHQYSWGAEGKYHELVAARKEQELEHQRIIKHYKRHTNLSIKQINKILLPASDTWLTPEEAIKYGIADKIIK